MAEPGHPSSARSRRGIHGPPVRGRPALRHPRQEGHDNAKRHTACETDPGHLGWPWMMEPQGPVGSRGRLAPRRCGVSTTISSEGESRFCCRLYTLSLVSGIVSAPLLGVRGVRERLGRFKVWRRSESCMLLETKSYILLLYPYLPPLLSRPVSAWISAQPISVPYSSLPLRSICHRQCLVGGDGPCAWMA